MARGWKSESQEKNEKLVNAIKGGMAYNRVSRQDIINATGISQDTFYRKMREPGKVTVAELRVYRKLCHISDDDLLSVL